MSIEIRNQKFYVIYYTCNNMEFIFMSTTALINYLDRNHYRISEEYEKNTKEAKQCFYRAFSNGVDYETAFDEAVKKFQEKTNPSEDMFAISERIGNVAKDTINPNKEDPNAWMDAFSRHTAPMLQMINEWVSYMKEG